MASKASKERLLFIFLVIAIILIFNFIINKKVIRLDLTEDKRYTISDSTRKILSGLDDIVNIDVYFSTDLPPQFRGLDEEIRSLLEELQAYAGRNLNIEFHNPKEDPETEYKLQALQIPKVRANIIEKDRAQVVELYLGMVIYYQDQKEVIPVVQNIANLEYDIVSKIIKVRNEKKHSIKLVLDPSRYQGMQAQMMTHNILQAMLAENFQYEAVPFEELSAFDETDLLIILPIEKPSEEFLYNLDQYLLKGKSAIFCAGGMKIHQQTMMASPYESEILQMLKHYGISVDGSLVLDNSNSMASFRTEFGFYSTHYPFWVALKPDNIDRTNPVTSSLESLILPYVSPVTVISETDDDMAVSSKILFRSSKMSYKKYSPINLSPKQDYEFRRDMNGNISLGILYDKPLVSYFSGRDIPSPNSSDFMEESITNSKIAVIGSEHILYDFFLQMNENNIVFLQNIVDWYTLGEELIGIRSKQIIQRPVKDLRDSERVYIKWIAILVIPLILLIFGLVKYTVKKHSRKLAMKR